MPLEQKESSSQKAIRCQRRFFILYQEFGHYSITRLTVFLLVALNWMDNEKVKQKGRAEADSAAKVR